MAEYCDYKIGDEHRHELDVEQEVKWEPVRPEGS